jgi:ATPase subunit of ABC transporter with duplicated ATPase domains
MGQMPFAAKTRWKPTRALSGGESKRLIFCKLMPQKPNFPGARRTDEPLADLNPSMR